MALVVFESPPKSSTQVIFNMVLDSSSRSLPMFQSLGRVPLAIADKSTADGALGQCSSQSENGENGVRQGYLARAQLLAWLSGSLAPVGACTMQPLLPYWESPSFSPELATQEKRP